MPKVLVDQQLLQAVVDYMTTKPFKEVAEIVLALQKTAQVYEEPKLPELPAKTDGIYDTARTMIKTPKEKKADGK